MHTFIPRLLWIALCVANHADAAPSSSAGAIPEHLPLVRPHPGATRIFVEAKLPTGRLGLFMVDTGAAISALDGAVAAELDLRVDQNWGLIEGLGGRAPLHHALLPTMGLGDRTLSDVDFAVDVPGVPTRIGALRIDGILGNNVWSQFVLELDYRANLLILHPPGTWNPPRRSAPLFFDGSHVYTPLAANTGAGRRLPLQQVVQLDTGASDLLLSGARALPTGLSYTEGLEAISGIGGAREMPPHHFLHVTRRTTLKRVRLGGRRVRRTVHAQWINFDEHTRVGPHRMRGLAGHELLDGFRVFLDYPGGVFAVQRSHRKRRGSDGHAEALSRLLPLESPSPTDRLYAAELQTALGRYHTALETLRPLLTLPTDDDFSHAARGLFSDLLRQDGALTESWRTMLEIEPTALLDLHRAVLTVDSMIVDHRVDEALRLANTFVSLRPDDPWSHVALADALTAIQRHSEAAEHLARANTLSDDPDGQRLRQAHLAARHDDLHGAVAQLRTLLDLYPFQGTLLGQYLDLVERGADPALFAHDLARALERLHPADRPFDYLVRARRVLGEPTLAREAMTDGLQRDCPALRKSSERANCVSWYHAMGGVHLARARRRIDRALARSGARHDFLDTKSAVHEARGELDLALDASRAALRLAPDDLYLRWQSDRLSRLTHEKR